jgi:hypothetical protein
MSEDEKEDFKNARLVVSWKNDTIQEYWLLAEKNAKIKPVIFRPTPYKKGYSW